MLYILRSCVKIRVSHGARAKPVHQSGTRCELWSSAVQAIDVYADTAVYSKPRRFPRMGRCEDLYVA